jgi:hypothetical protein
VIGVSRYLLLDGCIENAWSSAVVNNIGIRKGKKEYTDGGGI